MKQINKKLAVLAAVLALILSMAFMAGVFTEKTAPGMQPVPDASVQALYTVKAQPVEQFEAVPATIKAKQTTKVAARILAKVTRLNVRAGDYVHAGQLLLRLEQGDLLARLQQAKARKQAVAANLKEASSQWQRVQTLAAKGVLSTADVDKAKARQQDLQAQFQQSKQQVQEAELALAYSEIKAPIAGRVVERLVEPGDTVQPGQPLLSIYNPEILWAEASVRETLALKLESKQRLQVEVPALKLVLDASMDEMVPVGQTGSRSFIVKALLPETKGLLPGMYANINVPAEAASQIRIPSAYVSQFGQLAVVWVYNKQQLERRFVRLGSQNEGFVNVVSGLSPGEQLALKPNKQE